MNKQKGIKIVAATVVVVLFSINFIALSMIVQRDKEISELNKTNKDIVAKVDYLTKQVTKIDTGLVKVYSDTTMDNTRSVLKQLIDELVDRGFVSPIANWGQE